MPARLDRISNTTREMVNWLKHHPKVESVIFPLDCDFPQYELAKKQMKGACGLFSFFVKALSRNEIVSFCESLQHIMMAVSWGGYESLIIPKCVSIHETEFDPGNREHRQLRLYIGLEDPSYLIDDLEQAFIHIK